MSKKQGNIRFLDALIEHFIIGLFMAIVLTGIGILASYQYGHQQETICDRYINEYKINATFEKTFISGQCYIHTTDGLKIIESDFNLASVIEVQRLK